VVDESDNNDDDESVWQISTSLDSSVRSANCEVLHLNSNMVAASLKQSGLITDRAYSHLTSDEHTLTINALTFLLLLVQTSSNCYNLFIEAAQALCSRAMKPGNGVSVDSRAMKTGKSTDQSRGGPHVNNTEQNNWSGKTTTVQEQPTSSEDELDHSENADLANGYNDIDSGRQGLKMFLFFLAIDFCLFSFFSYNFFFDISLCHSGLHL